MLNLPLKQAETALANGQLDEAFSLVRSSDVRSTRPGQLFATRLVNALVERGNEHLSGGRVAAAASDAAKAVELGGQQPSVVELFEAVHQTKSDQSQKRRRDQEIVRVARQQIDRGVGTVGRRILDLAATGQREAKDLADRMDVQRELNDAALQRARLAVEEGDCERALKSLVELIRSQPELEPARRDIGEILPGVLENIHRDLANGRVDRVVTWRESLAVVAGRSSDARELVEVIDRLIRTSQALEEKDYIDADRQLSLIAQTIGETNWIKQAIDALQTIQQNLGQLQRGPLGLVGDCPLPPPLAETALHIPNKLREIPAAPSHGGQRLLLQVDGLGSVLLLPQDCVTVGPASRAGGVDVPIMTEGIEGNVRIQRDGGDYMLSSDGEVDINGKKTRQRLLQGDDVIRVGRRGRVRFCKPVAASATACLEFAGASMPRSDIRRVVLMADSIIIGSDANCHLSVGGLSSRCVIYRVGDALAVRRLDSPAGGGVGAMAMGNEPVNLTPGQSVSFDDVRLMLKVDTVSAGSSRIAKDDGLQGDWA